MPTLRIFLLLLGLTTGLTAAPTLDPLSATISPPGFFQYNSFNEAMEGIQKISHCNVACPPDVQEFMQTLWLKRGFSLDFVQADQKDKGTVKSYLNFIRSNLGMDWKYDSKTKTINLNLAWKKADPRQPPDLIQTVFPGGVPSDPNLKVWQDNFDALISRPENFPLAWKVRQQASLDNAMFWTNPLKPVLIQPIINTAGEKFYFFLLVQPIVTYPGRGSASYYWFRENGILVGAGLMNTGHRCNFAAAAIDNLRGARSDKPSELQMVLKFNDQTFLFARMKLNPDGVELIHLTDGYGEKVNNDGYWIGQSLVGLKQE